MSTLTLTRPDDWHLHVRDGEALAAVVPDTARRFGRALIMPNLRPPVTTVDQAAAYRDRILAAVPAGLDQALDLLVLDLADDRAEEDAVRHVGAPGRLAGVGAGLYPSVQEGCRRVIRLNAPQEPIEENVPKYEAFYRMYTKLYPALKDCYKELAAL